MKSRAGKELPDIDGISASRIYDLNEQAFLWIGELADAFPEKEFLLLFSGEFHSGKEAFLEFQCNESLDIQEVADILFDEEQYHSERVRVWPAEGADEEQITGVWFSGLSEEESEMVRIF